jgi:hypothetical protein
MTLLEVQGIDGGNIVNYVSQTVNVSAGKGFIRGSFG